MRKEGTFRGFEQTAGVMSLPPDPPRINNKLNFKEVLS